MKKSEYIERAKNAILNRVKFHAPIVYDSKIDRSSLENMGVELNMPIFKFDKLLTKRLLKAFEKAQKEENFNLLIPLKNSNGLVRKSTLNNVVVYDVKKSSCSFLETINKLNINYSSSSNYNLIYKDKFFKVDGMILNPHYEEFSIVQAINLVGLEVNYKEFVLNGNNFFVAFKNCSSKQKTVSCELNIPMKKGYYFFKKGRNSYKIDNLLSNETAFLNFCCQKARFSFSNVDGLENSVYCCINISVTFDLKPNEEKFLYFNLGESKFLFNKKEDIEKFFTLSKMKCREMFNLQVKTKNRKFDRLFNLTLPQKIWLNWLNGEDDAELERKYLTYKRLFLKGEKSCFSFVPFKEIGVQELGVFNGEYYKKVLIISGQDKFLKVGQTIFYNISNVNEDSLKNKEPICLCYGVN